MSIVTLVSGGIDSSLMALMTMKEDITQHPLFIDYGQLGRDNELSACRSILAANGLPTPATMDLSGFGKAIHCGLTDSSKDVFADAFLPGRNMLFLLAGSAYAYQMDAKAVAIGLLNEEKHLFPDQTVLFLDHAEALISSCMERTIKVVAPLISFHKSDVLQMAQLYGIKDTYSCHSGLLESCGVCISCKELFKATEKEV